jgi:4-amino-4-deoxy-L-arabinose transferase-like glycosyltransferase
MLSNAHLERLFENRSFVIAVISAALAVALLLRLFFASLILHPGHGDYPFYYTVAENLVDGRGFQVDYIWHYLNHPKAIPYTSHDYWMPLTSTVISIFMFMFGKSLFVALLPSIFVGLALAVLTYFISKVYSPSRLTAFLSAGVMLFIPDLFIKSIQTDSAIFYAFFVSASLTFIVQGLTRPKFFLWAAAFSGLAHLSRQDGLLLIIVLLGMVLLSRQQSIRAKVVTMSLAFFIYLIILSPLLISNFREFRAPFPPALSKTMFMTEYEDLYTHSKDLTLQNYLKMGTSEIVLSKARAAISQSWKLYHRLGEFLSIFVILGIVSLATSHEKRQNWTLYFPPLFFFAALFSFYALVTTAVGGGGFLRSSMALTPFFVIIGIDLMHRVIASKAIVCASVLFVITLFIYHDIADTRQMIDTTTRLGEQLTRLKAVVEEDAHREGIKEVVIMTRDPWEVYHSTRYKTLQIPNDGLEVIYTVAKKYGANYLLLPAPREAITALYEGKKVEDHLLFVANVKDSDLKLFRFRF